MAPKEKAKGEVQKVERREKKDGSGHYYVATIGGVEMLFFDEKIADKQGQEVEVEYSISQNGKFIGGFPGSKPSGGGGGFRKGPEDIKFRKVDAKLRTKTMCMAYAKDIAVAMIQNDKAGVLTLDKVWIIIDYFSKAMLNTVANNIKEMDEIN